MHVDRPRTFASGRWIGVATWILPPGFVLLFAWLTLGGASWNLHVPVAFSGDALFYLAQSKSTLDHGWWWSNPSMGAPIGYHALVFAQNSNVDQVIVWTVGRFTRDVGLAVNVAWLIMLALGALTTTWGLRRLGVSRVGAGVAGVLFALSPFAFYRHIAHFALVTYLIPFPATAAVLLASIPRTRAWRVRDMAVPAAGCALLGFNYIYFAFFGAFLVAVGTAIGWARIRSIAPLKWGGLCLGTLVLATSLNLIPNVLAWRHYGSAVGVQHTPAESEIYGLKVRHLVSPATGHWFPPFGVWLDRDAAASFPNENENRSARLGVVAAAGFLGVIVMLVVPRAAPRDDEEEWPHARAAGALMVAAVLLGTVGGFGAIFSLLVSPEIRAYNRISAFVAFFAFAAVAMWADRVTRTRPTHWRAWFSLLILIVGLSDQQVVPRARAENLPIIERELLTTEAFMSGLEAQLADNAMVYQLPVRPYPLDSGIEGMGLYDHFKPYLLTHRLRWSYPAMTVDQLTWERGAESVGEAELPRYLAGQGFSAILINRAAYADRARRLEQALQDAGSGVTIMATSDAFVALDLRHLRAQAPAR